LSISKHVSERPVPVHPAVNPASGSSTAREQSRRVKEPCETVPVVLLAVSPDDVHRYPSQSLRVIAAHTRRDALAVLDRIEPRVMVVDWDHPGIEAPVLCRQVIRGDRELVVMATMAVTEAAPLALKAGCDAILLKPFAANLAASRLGRLCREATLPAAWRTIVPRGTNRTWGEVACPACRIGGAVAFDHGSYRRSWYACLTCEHVWQGPRQE